MTRAFRAMEIFAGAGGQALGLEQAGFRDLTIVTQDPAAANTLRLNRPAWQTIQADPRKLNERDLPAVDLVVAGTSNKAPKGSAESDGLLNPFLEVLRIAHAISAAALVVENSGRFTGEAYSPLRRRVMVGLQECGYVVNYRLVNAMDFGLPQQRKRAIMVALRPEVAKAFRWPQPSDGHVPTVKDAIGDLMKADDLPGSERWCRLAEVPSPQINGEERYQDKLALEWPETRSDWLRLGVDGSGIAPEAPTKRSPLELLPRLTPRMVARLQGFPDDWRFLDTSATRAFRQIVNADSPPITAALASAVASALRSSQTA